MLNMESTALANNFLQKKWVPNLQVSQWNLKNALLAATCNILSVEL